MKSESQGCGLGVFMFIKLPSDSVIHENWKTLSWSFLSQTFWLIIWEELRKVRKKVGGGEKGKMSVITLVCLIQLYILALPGRCTITSFCSIHHLTSPVWGESFPPHCISGTLSLNPMGSSGIRELCWPHPRWPDLSR